MRKELTKNEEERKTKTRERETDVSLIWKKDSAQKAKFKTLIRLLSYDEYRKMKGEGFYWIGGMYKNDKVVLEDTSRALNAYRI